MRYFQIAMVGILLLACKKNKNKSIIDNVLPSQDILNAEYQDTFTILLKTQRIDSVRVYNDGFKYIGSNQDPVFGRTDAELYCHFSLPNNVTNVAFPSDAVVDSAKIILVFTENFVGDTTTPQRYQVYLLNENMYSTQTYYSNKKLAYINTALGDITTKPKLYKGFKTIQIPIYSGFAQGLISNSQYLVNTTILQNTYKGFYITTKNTILNSSFMQGALMKIDLANTISGFYVYYHTGNPPALKESQFYQFSFNNNNSVRMNHFIYNYASGSHVYLYNQLMGDSSSASQCVFVKGLNGTKVLVDFPYLKNLRLKSNVSINRAELVFKVDNNYISNATWYAPPIGMSLLALDSLGNEFFTIDQYYSSYPFLSYGGIYDKTNGEYRFNISRYIQQILDGKLRYHKLVLIATDPNTTLTARKDFFAARVVLGGYKHPILKPVLRLYFTPIP